jgi:hypothetical protein
MLRKCLTTKTIGGYFLQKEVLHGVNHNSYYPNCYHRGRNKKMERIKTS